MSAKKQAPNAFEKQLDLTAKMLAADAALNVFLIDTNKAALSTPEDACRPSRTPTPKQVIEKFPSVFSASDQLTDAFSAAYRFQRDILSGTQDFYSTDLISGFRHALMHNEYHSALSLAEKALRQPTVKAPDLMLLRTSTALIEAMQPHMPRGMTSAVKTLHSETAKTLSASDDISYDTARNKLFLEASPDEACSAQEANVLFSIARMFDDLSEADLIGFLSHLSAYRDLGSEHYVGKKILEIVRNFHNAKDFDCEAYYHARSVGDGLCPYTDEQMLRAPHGLPGHGRFNHPGQNYYYFSDKKAGAVREARPRRQSGQPPQKVQVVTLCPKDNSTVRLIDLSDKQENAFLKYCRFPYDENSAAAVRREYLVPSFFSTCCNLCGFDGIKYAAKADYHNYVTWLDTHFSVADREVVD